MDATESYIRSAAAQRGIDPDQAMRVARSEGFNSYTGDNGSSFGPFQLHYGNVAPGGNAVGGLGDEFTKQTGLDARNPNTVPQQIDFSLDHAAKNGWGPWHGWKGSPFAGINGNPTGQPMADQSPPTVMAQAQQQPQGPMSALFGANPTPVGGLGAIARMLGIGSEPGLGAALKNAGAALQIPGNFGKPGAEGAAALMNAANAPAIAMKPQLIDAGTDPLTNMKHFIQFNPATGAVSPPGQVPGAPGQAGTPGDGGSSLQAVRDAMNRGETGDDLFKYVPPDYQSYIKSLRDGVAIPGNMGRQGAARGQLLDLAHAIYPGMQFDETNIAARQEMAKSMANPSPNQLGGQIQSANTLMNHTSLLQNDIDNLEKLGVAGKNPIVNSVKQFVQGNVPGLINEQTQAAQSSFNKHLQAVSSELTKLTRGTSGSLQEVQDWKNGMHSADSIASLRSGTAAVVDLMHGRVQAGVDSYNRTMGKNNAVEDYLSAPAKAAIEKVSGQAEQYAPGAAQPAPAVPANVSKTSSGVTTSPQSTSAPQGPTIFNPKTGERRMLKDGKWQPM